MLEDNIICTLPILVIAAMLIIGVLAACIRSAQITREEEKRGYWR